MIEQIKIENNTTENVMYFISLPDGIPICSGTDAKTAAANPFGIISPMVLLSNTFAPFGAQYFAIIILLNNRNKVIKAPINIDLESEKGMLIPIYTKKNVFNTKLISPTKDVSLSFNFKFLFF